MFLAGGGSTENKFATDNVKAVTDDGGSLTPIRLERIVLLEKLTSRAFGQIPHSDVRKDKYALRTMALMIFVSAPSI